MTQGRFLSLDGLDGCGKSTQCQLLADWLRSRGRAVVSCREPGGTALGEQVRELVLHRQEIDLTAESLALLFMASRAQLAAEVIRPALLAGRVVVCDRFLLSTVVYQGHAGGLDPDVLWKIGQFATGGLEPDLTLVLDLPVETAQARRSGPGDRVEGRDAAYHQRVREGFLAEAGRRPDRIHVIDAALPVEAVQAQITQEVSRVLEAGPRA